MKELFNMDIEMNLKPSVGAIIHRDGKLLLLYSAEYNYYRFPGGEIKDGEQPEDTLIRKVRETTGLSVVRESIEAYGAVQERAYYFCEAEGEVTSGAVWFEAVVAAGDNKYAYHAEGADYNMIKREAEVIDKADLEIRQRERLKREAEAVRALGDLDYQDMLDYVLECLNEKIEYVPSCKGEIAYSRLEHTKRVLGWSKRLYEMSDNKEKLKYEDLIIATIFHDVGRAVAAKSGESHAKAGVPLTRDYLLKHGFEESRVEYICELVGGHSDKWRMKEPDLDPNLMMLMEADLMDDMGALGIVMDCMITETRNPEARFSNCFDHIMRYTYRIQKDNPMVTADARKLWDEKTRLVNDFTEALRKDIELSL